MRERSARIELEFNMGLNHLQDSNVIGAKSRSKIRSLGTVWSERLALFDSHFPLLYDVNHA
jgi:hypothetical protein